MQLSISLDNKQSAKFLDVMKNAPERIDEAQKIALFRCGELLRNDAGERAPYLRGNLRRSITSRPTATRVTVGSNLVYARIHDQGGTITPKKSNYLVFQVKGKWVKTRKVTIKPYKGQGYLTPAFKTLIAGPAQEVFAEEILKIFQ